MKKIMFNDKYGLTEAVLSGRKTLTRRIITCPKEFKGEWVAGFYVYKRQSDNAIIQWPCMYDADECTFAGGEILPKYKVGEVVAVAQSYKDIFQMFVSTHDYKYNIIVRNATELPGWSNKMFVRADRMPHHIRITNVRVERLQDISDEDCIKEGVVKGRVGSEDTHFMDAYYPPTMMRLPCCTPREAYAILIDHISGKGTWESNPYVFVYDFELVK